MKSLGSRELVGNRAEYQLMLTLNATPAERALIRKFRERGVRYVFQAVIAGRIVDFVIAEKIVIELDGKGHDEPAKQRADEQRTKTLNEFGFDVMRFKNEVAISDTVTVLYRLQLRLKAYIDAIDEGIKQTQQQLSGLNYIELASKLKQYDKLLHQRMRLREVYDSARW